MKATLTAKEHNELMPFILSVLKTGKAWEDGEAHYPAGALIEAVLTINGMKKLENEESGNGKGFDTNGWQWDWWQSLTCNGKNYTLSGSGYYGGHSFHLSDE